MTVAKYLLQRRIAHDALIPQLCMDLDNLVERAKAKDPQAFDTLYKMYFRKMMGVCLKIIKGDEETAKDLVHDAFVLAFISLGDLRDNRKFGEWLTTIVRNVSYKNVGKKSGIHLVPLTSVSGEDQLAAPAAFSSESAVDSRELQELISRLPEGYRTVFRLSVIEGFSHKEIAGMLGIEPHSSSSQLTRAKALLRKMLDRNFGLSAFCSCRLCLCMCFCRAKGRRKRINFPLRKRSQRMKRLKKSHQVGSRTAPPWRSRIMYIHGKEESCRLFLLTVCTCRILSKRMWTCQTK